MSSTILKVSKTRSIAKYVLIPLLCLFLIYVIIFVFMKINIRLTYQQTGSMPEGVYLVYPSEVFVDGNDILFEPTKEIESYMIERGYLQKDTPLLKQIVATKNDDVCIVDKVLFINGSPKGNVHSYDTKGRPLIHAEICRQLKAGEYFVMGVSSSYSFDSRYYGVVTQNQIIGKAKQLWSR
jgi:conjugative transfer signal peptidase TraF